jgi:hypothetical protein
MTGVDAATGPGTAATRRGREIALDVAWLAVLFAWSAGWCLTAAPRLGPTYDEPFYLEAGLEAWRSGSIERLATHGVMPLPVLVATVPLYLHEDETGTRIEEPLEYLRPARAMTLGWSGLLIVSALRLGRAVGGPAAGRVAAGLVAADPTILAHSSLATTDVAVTAVLLAFTAVVYAGRGGGIWGRVLWPGLWYGVAAVTKLSGLLYGGLILVVLEVAFRLARGQLNRPAGATPWAWSARVAGHAGRSALAVTAVVVIGVGLAVLACGTPEAGRRPLALLPPKIPDDEPLKPSYVELARTYDRVPYAVVAFAFQWWHNSRGRPAYLNGTFYPEGCWFYFPVVLAMKTPLPVLALGLLALLRPRAVFHVLTAVTVVLLLVTLRANLQTGVRHVLPVLVLGYVGVAVAVCRGLGRFGCRAGTTAVATMLAVSAWVWPHGLGYLNQLFGGPSAAFYRVSDSNLDWGQGLPDLLEWHRANGRPPLALWYFGTDLACHRPPFVLIPFEKLPITSAEQVVSTVDRKLLAVGATQLTLHPELNPAKAVVVNYLKGRRPLTHTATFLIYDFRDPSGPPPREPGEPHL